jgi:hypothetical protein
MRAVRARMFALLAALILLLPGGGAGRAQYYCQMMGRVVATCCCETGAAAHAPDAAREFQAADCCQRISSARPSASLGTHEALRGVPAAALLSTVPQPFPVSRSSVALRSCAESTQAKLAIGPPLFVKHCALLS